MLVFLILAGGFGSRFWPISKKDKPKQLLTIFSDKPLLLKTVERLEGMVDMDRVFIATSSELKSSILQILPNVNESRIIIEPDKKDTCMAIAYSSMIISKYYDNPTICVLPSDHLIDDIDEFQKVIIEAYENKEDKIITIGIKPTRPSTDYGYIKSFSNVNTITKVLEFKEKPDLNTANAYIEDGNYLWNSGIFLFNYSFLIEELRKYEIEIYDVIMKLEEKDEVKDIFNLAKELFGKVKNISLDYAILEKTNKVYVIEAQFKWSDVGSYLYLEEVLEKDKDNNIIKNTNYVGVDSNNNIIISDVDTNINISLLGVNNMIISITKEDILLVNKEDINKLKELTNSIDKQRNKE